MPISYVVRAVNKKSYKEIHDDIRHAQTYDHYGQDSTKKYYKLLKLELYTPSPRLVGLGPKPPLRINN